MGSKVTNIKTGRRKSSAKGTSTAFKRCFHDHPPLPLKNGLVVYGGSCSAPVHKDADIYVGLDYSMADHPQFYPWNAGHAIHYRITDRQAPADAKSFVQLIAWLAEQIEAGHKAHIGCIGGHGRTGTVLAALVAHMGITKDAITYVRKHYCKKVVETQAQVNFLAKHFGIKKAAPSKKDMFSGTYPGGKKSKAMSTVGGVGFDPAFLPDNDVAITHVRVEGDIWGKNGKK